jgi:hypothetical protein
MSITVAEIYEVHRSRRGEAIDAPEGVLATDLTDPVTAPQVVAATGAIQVNSNTLSVVLQNDGAVAYCRVSPKHIITTGTALASSAAYWRIPAGGSLTLGVHGGAVISFTI